MSRQRSRRIYESISWNLLFVSVASTLLARSRNNAGSVLEKNNEVRRFAVQQTRLAKQKQLRRGCIQSRLRSDFTMPEAGGSVQFKKSMLRIGGKGARPNACWLSTGGTACYLRSSQ